MSAGRVDPAHRRHAKTNAVCLGVYVVGSVDHMVGYRTHDNWCNQRRLN